VLHIVLNPKNMPGKTFSRTYLERYWHFIEQVAPGIPIDNVEAICLGLSLFMGSASPDFAIKEHFRKVGVIECTQ